MDKLATYRELIRKTLTRYAELINSNPTPGVETELVFDEEHGNYLLLNVGWSGRRRVRGTTLHIRLRNGKIWIEEDWTEHGTASDLMEAGVPKEDIVLAFQHPQMRPFTEFAVA
jgi:hypothetical protein